ncbi:MAG TPA: H-X9-DG-CTERM domain-containing protein, partial [Abditibacterium sp.]
AQDYNERLPLISAGKQGWAEEVQPYLKSWQLFQCPAAEKRLDEKGQLSSDYFINARVSGLNESKIPFRGQTLLLGDGIDNGATTSHFSELPLDWKTDDHSPARRHLDGANYAFADGHVKWLKPDQISDQPPNSEVKSTFALR